MPGERAKNKKRHAIPLGTLALEIIEAAPEFDGPFLFSTTGGDLYIKGQSKKTAELRAAAELEDFKLKDLRETCATVMRERLSITSDVIGQVLNHSNAGVTQVHYATQHSMVDKRRALESWDRYLQRLIGREVDNVIPLRA